MLASAALTLQAAVASPLDEGVKGQPPLLTIAWPMQELRTMPVVEAADVAPAEGLQAVWIPGLPYQGKPTRVFAYLGIPAGATKCPGVVLAHGGGGTAMADWVRAWVSRGYAAVAMDLEGQVPIRPEGKPKTWMTIDSLNRPFGGGPARDGSFGDWSKPVDQQWPWHAVAALIRAGTVLGGQAGVDPQRIGMVGISWGSVLVSIAASVDDRMRFVVPQYIGGNLHLGNVWYPFMHAHPVTFSWDPARWYGQGRRRPGLAWLWIDGMNDTYGLPPMITKSWQDTQPDSWMVLLPTLGHGHLWGDKGTNAVREIAVFTDQIVREKPSLLRVRKAIRHGDTVTVSGQAQVPVTALTWAMTTDELPMIEVAGEKRVNWAKVVYKVQPVEPLPQARQAGTSSEWQVPVPAGFKAGALNAIDQNGNTVTCGFFGAEDLPRR